MSSLGLSPELRMRLRDVGLCEVVCIVLQLCYLCVAEAHKRKITHAGLGINGWLALACVGFFFVLCVVLLMENAEEVSTCQVHHALSETPVASSLQP